MTKTHQWTAQLEITPEFWLPAIPLLPPANSWRALPRWLLGKPAAPSMVPFIPSETVGFYTFPSWWGSPWYSHDNPRELELREKPKEPFLGWFGCVSLQGKIPHSCRSQINPLIPGSHQRGSSKERELMLPGAKIKHWSGKCGFLELLQAVSRMEETFWEN